MKMLLYVLILTLILVLPEQGTDVGKLIPVEIIAVSKAEGKIAVRTDTGDCGEGKSLEEALDDLEDTAPGTIYLDTAEYLVLEAGMEDPGAMRAYLKDSVRLYRTQASIDPEDIADYLSAHPSETRLKDASEFREIPVLTKENGRYRILKNDSKNEKLGIDKK